MNAMNYPQSKFLQFWKDEVTNQQFHIDYWTPSFPYVTNLALEPTVRADNVLSFAAIYKFPAQPVAPPTKHNRNQPMPAPAQPDGGYAVSIQFDDSWHPGVYVRFGTAPNQ